MRVLILLPRWSTTDGCIRTSVCHLAFMSTVTYVQDTPGWLGEVICLKAGSLIRPFNSLIELRLKSDCTHQTIIDTLVDTDNYVDRKRNTFAPELQLAFHHDVC